MRLRLGMYVRSVSDRCDVCRRQLPSQDFSLHAMHCIPLSGASITDRHNAVLHTIAHYARLMLLSPRVEPAQLCHDSAKRPDIQLDLPVRTLLADVSVIHPLAPSNYKKANSRVVERIGDAAAAVKNAKYKELVESQDIRFSPLIFYTYGGFHRSALSFIKLMTAALDEQACLLSRAEWKKQLLEHIAIAVQRGNADIMIRNDQRGRARTDWWIMGGGDRTHRRRRRRLTPPLYSVYDVPWMRSSGDAASSPSSSDREEHHRSSQLTANDMQVDDACDSAVQREDSGVSGSYVSGCSTTPVLAQILCGLSGDSSGCDGGERHHNAIMAPAMVQEEMACGREELVWRESGCDMVFNPRKNNWTGSRVESAVAAGGDASRQSRCVTATVSGSGVYVEAAVAAGGNVPFGSGVTVAKMQGGVVAAESGGVGDDVGAEEVEEIGQN